MNSKKDFDKPLLLDIGCGKNKLSRPGYKIIGIDICENSDADLIIPANKLPFVFLPSKPKNRQSSFTFLESITILEIFLLAFSDKGISR